MASVRTAAEFGAVARAGRLAQGWTQQQAANEAGVSRQFVIQVESGKHARAELWRVLALLASVGVELTATTSPTQPSPERSVLSGPHVLDLATYLDAFRGT
jgi:HTH-type transcriptional regulator/antitoxin HipB